MMPLAPTAWAVGTQTIYFGFPNSELATVRGIQPAVAYGMSWVGWVTPWNSTDETTVKNYIRQALSNNSTPVLLWYYWGDRISPECVENGCRGREDNQSIPCNNPPGGSTPPEPECRYKAEWYDQRNFLIDILEEELGPGDEVIIVVENEFHKHGIHKPEYAPTFDEYLRQHNVAFDAVPGVKTIVGFGPWAVGEDTYKLFPKAVTSSDMLGSMILYSAVAPGGSDRYAESGSANDYEWGDRPDRYLNGVDDLLAILTELWDYYGVNGAYGTGPDITESFVYDMGFASFNDTEGDNYGDYLQDKSGAKAVTSSAYTEAEQEADGMDWEDEQYAVLDALFDRLQEFKDVGVQGIVFRTYEDGRGNAPERNYHFLAEWWFGLKQIDAFDSGGTKKQAHDMVFQRIGEEAAGADPNAPPDAAFTYSCTGRTCSFDGRSSSDSDGSISTYHWEFGDGGVGTGATPSYTYASGGTYSVRLAVTDDAGRTSQVTKSVPVSSSSTFIGRHEAEDFPTKSTGALSTESDYSGGKGWNLWTNGYIEKTITNDAADEYALTVRAKGTLGGSAYPHMVLHVNGVVVKEWDVGSTSLVDYTTTVSIPSGSTTFRIQFTNDYVAADGDRNLKVDFLDIAAARSGIPGKWEAESFDYKSTGGIKNGADYSGGKGWEIWSNGYIEQKIYNGAQGSYLFTIRAEGDLAGTELPRMRLWINGAYVQDWNVGSETLVSYTTTQTLNAGEQTVRIYFANDCACSDGDRNLEVDYLAIQTETSEIPGTVEAENFELKSTGGLKNDAEFSAGKGWNIWTNGYIEHELYNGTAGVFKIRIRAEGDLAGSAYPRMVLKIDGTQVAAWDVTNGESPLYYDTTQTLSVGDHDFRIEFTNDYRDTSTGADRNLEVDLMSIVPN